MPYVGFSGVVNQANTTDGFALGVGAQNDPAATDQFGLDVGDGGVVDLYHDGIPTASSFILMENSGYVLEENSAKIQLEVG
jgi:hypothetical protein